jgi:hypothetical protein
VPDGARSRAIVFPTICPPRADLSPQGYFMRFITGARLS